MKKFLFLFSVLFLAGLQAHAAEGIDVTRDREIKTVVIDREKVEGKLKAGLALGYPTGLTAGYRFSNFFELNGTFGSDFDSLTTGVNGLFTLMNIDISGEIFTLSAGPALNTHFNKHHRVDALAVARLEYTLRKVPLNLFAEAGAGLRVIEFADTAASAAVGVRYVF